jgi:hypothetical protein
VAGRKVVHLWHGGETAGCRRAINRGVGGPGRVCSMVMAWLLDVNDVGPEAGAVDSVSALEASFGGLVWLAWGPCHDGASSCAVTVVSSAAVVW